MFTKFQSLNFKFKFRVAEVPLALALRVKFTVTVAGWVFTGKRGKKPYLHESGTSLMQSQGAAALGAHWQVVAVLLPLAVDSGESETRNLNRRRTPSLRLSLRLPA